MLRLLSLPVLATAIAVRALIVLASGPHVDPAVPPLDSALTLRGVVIEVECEGMACRILLAEPEVTTDDQAIALARPIRVRFDWLDQVPMPGAAITFRAELGRARLAFNPTTVPRGLPPLFAHALTVPTPDARSPAWSTLLALELRQRLTFESQSATALFRALILGDRSELDPETRYAYQDTGTAHLLAISGMNLALIGLGLFRLLLFLVMHGAHTPGLRRLGLARLAQGHRPRVLAAAIALAATAAYTALIAPSDATDRALAALAITFGGIVLFRATTAARTLLLCFLGAAAVAPEALLHAGFQLSFAATASLVLIAPHVRRVNERIARTVSSSLVRRVLVFLVALVLADIACFLVTAPLTVAWFGQLPVHSLWVNLVAIPFMSFVVFPAGVIWVVLAMLVPSLGDLLAPVLADLGDAFNAFIRTAGDVSGSASTEAWPLAIGVVACLSFLAMLSLRPPHLRLGAVGLLGSALVALAIESPPAGLSLTALDVGHGDALALRLPDGTRVLIDTGGKGAHRPIKSDPSRQIAERVVVPALRASGFATIDLLVITHSDLDHVGAAEALAERIPIRHLWLPPCSRSPTVRALVARLERAGARIHDVARAAPFDFGGARFEILSPAADIQRDGGCTKKDNDASLVFSVSYAGRRLLLTGDAEAATELDLLSHYDPDRLAADVLKVAHHGSKTSSTDAFLDVVAPRVAVVSGLPGRRPPPHPAVLARYRERAIDLLVTGTDGAITVGISPEGELTRTTLAELRPP